MWSPDGTHIAFLSNCTRQDIPPKATFKAVTAHNIWVMNSDGSNPKALTPFDRFGSINATAPVWSPDGHKIAFSSNASPDWEEPARIGDDGNNLWVINADGSGAERLRHFARGDITLEDLSWSPDGRKLAFISNRALDGRDALNATRSQVYGSDEIPNLWVINADGSGLTALTKLTSANSYVESPVWSPDSHQLAFSWHRALDNTAAVEPVSPSNIWVVNADGTGLTPITKITDKLASASEPQWSPDGSKLIFCNGDIWIVKADGSGSRRLTDLAKSSDEHPFGARWSPDGTRIAFYYFDTSIKLYGETRRVANIWLINADGSGAVPVTHWRSLGLGFIVWRP